MKVSIDAGGRRVDIECGEAGVSYRELADKALEVWSDTEGARAGAMGFAQIERTPDRVPSTTARRGMGVVE